MQRPQSPLRRGLLIMTLALGLAVPSPILFASTELASVDRQARVPTPTQQELESFRKKLRTQTTRSQKDNDRLAFLMLLIDYAQVSVRASASRGERQYYLTQLQTFVAGQKAQKGIKGRGTPAWPAGGQSTDMRTHGPSADPICYHEGVEAECATDEEIAETQALADSVAYQNDENQQTYDEVMLMIAGLDIPEAAEVMTGPRAVVECRDCFSEAATATASMGASVAAVLGWEGAKADAIAAGTKLSKATRWSWHLTLITTSLTAGYYLGSLIDCARSGRTPVPEPVLRESAFPSSSLEADDWRTHES